MQRLLAAISRASPLILLMFLCVAAAQLALHLGVSGPT